MHRNRLLNFLWVAPLLLLAPVLFTGQRMYFGTISLQFIPWRRLAAEMLAAGQLPLWNPLSGGGAPLLANYQSALLYPPTWVLLAAARLGGVDLLAWAQGAVIAAHLVLSGWGMARLGRALGLGVFPQALSGLAFGLSGYLVARAHFASINAAAAWLPWVLLAVYRVVRRDGGSARRGAFGLTGSVALLLLAGHAQTAWYVLLLAGFWGLFWLLQPDAHSHEVEADHALAEEPSRISKTSRAALLAGGVLAGTLIAAAQLLPTAELLMQSQRAGGAGETFVMTYSFWPWRILGLFMPGLFGSPASDGYWGYGNYWEDAVYIGLLPVFLALRAIFNLRDSSHRRSLIIFLSGLTGVSFLLALGQNTPVFPWLYRNVPTFDLFQAPARYTIWAVFALALLAGIGAQGWAKSLSSFSRHQAARWTSVGLAFLLSGVLILMFLPNIEPSFGRSALFAGIFGALSASTGLARRRGLAWQAGVLLLVCADLLFAGWGLNPSADRTLYTRPAPDAAVLRDRLDGGRLFLFEEDEYSLMFDRYFRLQSFDVDLAGLRSSQLPNLNLLDGLPSASQFDPLIPADYAGWAAFVEKAPEDMQAWLLSQAGVSVLQRYDHESGDGLRFITQDAHPRVQWFACALSAGGSQEAFQRFLSAFPDPDPVLVVEPVIGQAADLCHAQPGESNAGSAQITSASSRRVTIRTETDEDGWLLLRDTYYPGWDVEIDGEMAFQHRANGLFRAVHVPAGIHEVAWTYRPGSWTLGLALSALGLALTAAGRQLLVRKNHGKIETS